MALKQGGEGHLHRKLPSLKTLNKEMEDLRKWKDFPCSRISIINIVNSVILSKTIDSTPETFFTKLEKNLKNNMETQKTPRSQNKSEQKD